MSMHKKLAWSLVTAVVLLSIGAIAGWRLITLRIRANERAPHLEAVDRQAVDFAFKTLDGEPKHLSDFKGRTVFVDLWGTWCIQCIAEMPTVQRLYEHYQSDPNVVFLVISRLDSPAKVRLYATANHYSLPFYTMDDSDIPSSMQLNQFPATFLYRPTGNLAAQHVGAADWSAPAVIAFVDSLHN